MKRRAKTPKVSKEHVKAAAARAEARSTGKEIDEPKAPITPPIVPAAEIAAKTKPAKKRRKRRTLYSAPLGKALCKMLARGHTLTSICKRPGLPREDVVLNWAANPAHPFSDQYARAREVGYLRMADQLVDIADNSVNDYMETVTKDGEIKLFARKEVLERTRLRIDTRKWLLSKALPKIYGDKLQAELSGKVEQVHSEAPQPVDSDHMADITKRFATKIPGASLSGSSPKANGKGSSGLH